MKKRKILWDKYTMIIMSIFVVLLLVTAFFAVVFGFDHTSTHTDDNF